VLSHPLGVMQSLNPVLQNNRKVLLVPRIFRHYGRRHWNQCRRRKAPSGLRHQPNLNRIPQQIDDAFTGFLFGDFDLPAEVELPISPS